MSARPAAIKRRPVKKTGGNTAAVIVAAGSSLRMGDGVKKQFLKVNGIPVLARTMQSFEECRLIGEIIVVAKEEDLLYVSDLAAEYHIRKLTAVVAGGDTRAASARCGFERISARAKYVAIHDGARCLVTPAEIEKVCRAAFRYKAASAATRVSDTVKLATRTAFVDSTLDRNHIYLAATPQIFSANLYRAALTNEAATANLTDDNQLMELLPHRVKLVECSKENIKITYPEDVSLAEFYLDRREGLR